jgi:hypothetical protein
MADLAASGETMAGARILKVSVHGPAVRLGIDFEGGMMRTVLLPMMLAMLVMPTGLEVGTAAQTPPPNILLIVSDDHAWTDYGFMGHAVVKTPALDTLAAEGMLYTRGYVPTALCRPSLATLLTGRYPHQHGITGNDPPGGAATMLNPARRAEMVDVFRRNNVLPALLAEKGYVSFQSGKWWEGRPQDVGFTKAMTHGDVARQGRHGDEGLTIGRQGLQPIYDFIDSAAGKPFVLRVVRTISAAHAAHAARSAAEEVSGARRGSAGGTVLRDDRVARRNRGPTPGPLRSSIAPRQHSRRLPGRQRLDTVARPWTATAHAREDVSLRRRYPDPRHHSVARPHHCGPRREDACGKHRRDADPAARRRHYAIG